MPDGGFDYDTCPISYNAPLPGPTRYRLIATGRAAWDHSDTCTADLPGATHLVVLETMPELLSVSGFVAANAATIAANAVWVGGVQLRTALTPRDGWLGFDGAPLIDAWDPGEPNDTGGDEADHGEQFVSLENARHSSISRARPATARSASATASRSRRPRPPRSSPIAHRPSLA